MGLILEDISVDVGSKEILKSINLNIRSGEFISLIGSSGCGKSTLLKTIAGIIEQKSGSIYIDDNKIDKLPPHKRNTVILFQDFRLFPNMTVGENVEFPLKIRGVKKHIRKLEAEKLLKKVQLENFYDRQIDEISGGQMQRIALARALASSPTILLLDEPFSSLDVNLKKDMRYLVSSLQREFNITTVLVTHDQEEALSMSNRVAFMDSGQIIQYDTPKNIFNKPNNSVVAEYFSSGTYIYGQVDKKIFKNDFIEFKTDMEDGKYKCLIRPSAIKLNPDPSGEYKIVEVLYKGDRNLVKVKNIYNNTVLEALVSDKNDFKIDDMVDLGLYPKNLILLKDM